MKKLLIVVLALSLAGLAFGCGDDGEECTAGALGCACLAGDTCTGALVCNTTTDLCEEAAACCTNQQVHVSGAVVDVTTQQGIVADLGPVAPMGFITGTNTTPLTTTTSAANGTFATDCFDATNVALGQVVLADDAGFDGAAGTYFPTGTGVKAWSLPEEKVCVEGATVFAVPNTMVTGLSQLPGFAAADGFVLGFVMDAARAPVADAVVKKADGTDFATIYYPNATFTDFTGTATSATGMFLIPGPVALVTAKPEKAGMTWGESQVAAVPNYCYMSMMIAD